VLGKNKTISIKGLWPLLLPILLLLPGITGFAYPANSSAFGNISDLSISHYPNAVFLQQSIIRYGQIPLWSPSILSGYPFAANPLSGLWYPPGWLALLMPLPFGFNVVAILHLLLAGLGMYLLIRQLGRSHEAALFGAIAFEALPKIFAHYGAGHITMLYAISLTPWLLLAELRRQNGEGNFWLRQPGILLALIVLADPRWGVYAGLFWLAFSLFGSKWDWRKSGFGILGQMLIAFALSSPLLLPLLEYSQLSTRAHLAAADLLAFSFPFAGFFGLLAPQFGGFHEWVIYCGVIVLLLAFIAAIRTHKQRLDWFWIFTLGICVVFSLGKNIPGLSLLAGLPGLSLLRVPPRILPIAGFSMIMLAATAIDALQSTKLDKQSWRRARLGIVAIIGLQAGLGLAIWEFAGQIPINYFDGFILSLVFLVVVLAFANKKIGQGNFWILLIVLTLLDLGTTDVSLFSTKEKSRVLAEGSQVASFLAQQPGQFRVYSPSYSIPQQTAAEYGLELADGVDPLQLQTYADFMQTATGIQSDGYSVTLPAIGNDPSNDNQEAKPNTTRLALLNVSFVASEFEINVPGLELVDKFGTTYLYRLTEYRPRAFIENNPEAPVSFSQWTPNRIALNAEGPGQLILSELMYPGWIALVDGKQADIESYQGILRSVQLAEGSHEVIFEFRPMSVYLGILIFLVAVSFLGFYSRVKKK
jgi:hypothetical protein